MAGILTECRAAIAISQGEDRIAIGLLAGQLGHGFVADTIHHDVVGAHRHLVDQLRRLRLPLQAFGGVAANEMGAALLEQGDQALVIEDTAVHQAHCHVLALVVLVQVFQAERLEQARHTTGRRDCLPKGKLVQALALAR